MGGKVRQARAGLLAGLMVTGLVAAGCGSSGKATAKSSSSTTASSVTTTTPPTTAAVDAAADAAKAHQINLTAADLPAGWTSTAAEPKTAQDQADDASIAACLGAPDPKQAHTADVDSDDFHNGDMDVSSNVTFVRNADDARKELAASTTGKLSTCLKPVLDATIAREQPGATVTSFSLTPTPAPPGGDGGFGYHVLATVSAQGQQVQVVVDAVGVLVGRAELQVTAQGLAGQAPSDQLLRDLMAKLVARAK